MRSPEELEQLVGGRLQSLDGAVVAYSGGVDSALLALLCREVMGKRMLAILAESPSLAESEKQHAIDFAQQHDIPLRIVQSREFDDPDFRKNSPDRCYHCKKVLFQEIRECLARESGDRPLLFGMNADDLGDYRPGHRAADEAEVIAPFAELGIRKAELRLICKAKGLPLADKPASPCLASRVPYGQEVTEEKMRRVELAEAFLRDLGFRELRVRHHDNTARIEVPPSDMDGVMRRRQEIVERLKDIGFTFVSLDMSGFQSGSLNSVLKEKA